jgi:amino acid permease
MQTKQHFFHSNRLRRLLLGLAFLLTMPGAAGLLALPIALAQVGTAWGLALVLGFGLINLLTATALAETVVRSGTARFGLGFLGQLAQEYLGQEASVLLTIVLAANNFLVLIIFFLGVAGTLGGGTPLATVFWLMPLAAVMIYVLSRRSLNTTVAVTLLIVLANLLILLLIPLLALPYFRLANLLGGASAAAFTPAALGSMVGVLSSTFLSHFVVATYGPVVLSRDPSGRTWVKGSASALAVYILIACLWLLVINGVLTPATLSQSGGAVVIPLAAVVGWVLQLLGSVLVVLSVGLTALQVALGLYYLVEERLPARNAASWVGRLGENQRFVLAISPVLVALAVTIWLALSGTGSFVGLLGIVSVFTLPLVTGILPLSLLVATRRKGDFAPGYGWRRLGHPLVIGPLYLFAVATVLIHGLYIWEAGPLRVAAIIGGLALLIMTVRVWQQGLLAGRVVITLRQDERLHGSSQLQIVSNGQPLPTEIELQHRDHTENTQAATVLLPNAAAMRALTVTLPAIAATQVKVWLHRLTPEGASTGLPAQVLMRSGADQQTVVLSPEQGQVTLPLTAAGQVEIRLADQV